jgi:hypothetical protein
MGKASLAPNAATAYAEHASASLTVLLSTFCLTYVGSRSLCDALAQV